MSDPTYYPAGQGLEMPPLLLVGDVTYDLAVVATGQVPGTGAGAQQLATIAQINALRDRLPDLVVIAPHDPRWAE